MPPTRKKKIPPPIQVRSTSVNRKLSFPKGGMDLSRAFFKQLPRQTKASTPSTTNLDSQPIVSGVDVQGQPDPQYWGSTTVLGINVRGFEPTENRSRGGSRPGLSRYIPARPGNASIIQGLGTIVEVPMAEKSVSGRQVTLVSVVQGNIYWALAGDTKWTSPVNATKPLDLPPLVFTGLVRSAVANQIMYFADGVNWVQFAPSTNTVSTWIPGTTDNLGNPIVSVLPTDSDKNKPRLIVNWRNRICLAGLIGDPQVIFLSALGDPYNFDYGPKFTTPTQATLLSDTSPAGYVGDIVMSMMPYTNDVMVIGCDHSLYMVNGDPMNGGQVDRISSSIGTAFGEPWCMDPYGSIYFFSNHCGIYTLIPGQQPQRISQQIEQLIQNTDTGTNSITSLWDDRFQGVHFFITPLISAQPATHLFYEQRTGAWWQDQFANPNHNPLCCTSFDGNVASDRVPIIGSWDGWVRSIDPFATNDDGYPIASQVILGPILTQDMDEIQLHELQAVLGETSGEVDFNVYVGATAEQALASDPIATGTWDASRSVAEYVRRAGHACYVGISSNNPWTLEAVRARIDGLGKVRRRSKF